MCRWVLFVCLVAGGQRKGMMEAVAMFRILCGNDWMCCLHVHIGSMAFFCIVRSYDGENSWTISFVKCIRIIVKFIINWDNYFLY